MEKSDQPFFVHTIKCLGLNRRSQWAQETAQPPIAVNSPAAGRANAGVFGNRHGHFMSETALGVAANRFGDALPFWAVAACRGKRMSDFVQNGVAHFGFAVEQHELGRKRDSLFSPVALAEAYNRAVEFEAPLRREAMLFH